MISAGDSVMRDEAWFGSAGSLGRREPRGARRPPKIKGPSVASVIEDRR